MRIVLYRDLSAAQLAALKADFPDCEFRVVTDPVALAEQLDWPEIVFGNAPVSLLRQAAGLRWVQIVSSGLDEYTPLKDNGVTVTTGQGLHAPIIARHVLMMILLFTRSQWYFDRCQRAHKWDRQPLLPKPAAGQTIGLVGFGNVGHELVPLVRPLGFRVVGVRRQSGGSVPPGVDRIDGITELDRVLAESDHVVLSLPLTPETRGLLDAARFARFKPGAIFHNIARGGLIDEAALLANLQSGHLGGAALDVFDREPLADQSPFWDLPNVLITPHIAGHDRDLGVQMLHRFRENLRAYLTGRPVAPVANFARGY